MGNASVDFDSARAILSTYHKVNDAAFGTTAMAAKSHKKHRALLAELNLLKEQYTLLQSELLKKDKRLAHLKNELMDKTTYMTKLQEDFQNAIDQIAHRQQQSLG